MDTATGYDELGAHLAAAAVGQQRLSLATLRLLINETIPAAIGYSASANYNHTDQVPFDQQTSFPLAFGMTGLDGSSNSDDTSSSYFETIQQQQQASSQSTWSLLLATLFYKLDEFDINWSNFILAMILVMLMLTTAIGNLFVIVAILIERNLRTIGNYLVLSLAIADLLVACLVMPLAGIYQILERWTLGVLLCDIWTSADVFCCTASILHLLAIALDRYWAVTRVDYIRCQRNERRILLMIFFVWSAACIISLAPVFGWKDAQFELRITKEQECLISQDVGYQIFATCTTFYFPLTLTLIFYWKIYQVARKRIRRKPGNRIKISLQHPSSNSSSSSPATKQSKLKPRQAQTTNQSKVDCSQPTKSNQGQRGPNRKQQLINSNEIDRLRTQCQCSCHVQGVCPIMTSSQSKPNRLEYARVMSPDSAAEATTTMATGAKFQNSSFNAGGPRRLSETSEFMGKQLDQGYPGDQAAAPGLARSLSGATTIKSMDKLSGSSPSEASNQRLVTTAHGQGGGGQTCELTLNDNPNTGLKRFSVDNQIFDTHNMDAGQSRAIQMKDRQPGGGNFSAAGEGAAMLSTTKMTVISGQTIAAQPPEAFKGDEASSEARLVASEANTNGPRGDNDHENGLDDGDNNSTTPPTSSSNSNNQAGKFEPFAVASDGPDNVEGSELSKCRRFHWSSGEKFSPASITSNGCLSANVVVPMSNAQSNYKGSLSSEIQSLCSPSSSFANGLTPTGYNGDCQQQQQPQRPERDSCLIKLGGQIGHTAMESERHSLQNQSHLQQQQNDSNGTCVDDDCCGCCCDTSDQLIGIRDTQINIADNNQEQQETSCSMQAEVSPRLVVSAGIANGCFVESGDDANMRKDNGRPLDSRITFGEGGLTSELVMPSGEDSNSHRKDLEVNGSSRHHQLMSRYLVPVIYSIRGFWRWLLRQHSLFERCVNSDRLANSKAETGGHRAQLVIVRQEGCASCAGNHLASRVENMDYRGVQAPIGRCGLASGGREVDGASGAEDDDAGMAIAASTAAIAVTTVRPPMVTTDSVQIAAEGLESKRERKAAKTLAIITGVFVMCWLPFFVMAITMSLLNLRPHKYVFALMLWLGYVNSMLNPIIYTIFSPDFRKAFKRLLCGLDIRAERRKEDQRRSRLNQNSLNGNRERFS